MQGFVLRRSKLMGYWIVIVDDDVIELRNARNLLSGGDMRVSCLHSGADLLHFMENNTPDLVLLDILMPDMDGFESFHALRALEEEKGRNATPVIFLSGDNDSAAERRGLKDGASDFIRKPFDKEILESRIINTIENHKKIELLTADATLDKLTGFMNKGSGTDKIAMLCRKKDGALMFFDMDNFKLVNDIYGHDMGDQVLISFADIMRHNTREGDIIARVGGDEFLIFFDNFTSKAAVKALADRLNEQLLNKCIELMGNEFDIPIGLSIGAAFIPEHSRDFETLYRCVDSAMYRVKQNGKHGVRIYEDDVFVDTEAHEGDIDADMARICKILEERSSSEGAMVMGKETFIHTYRFAMRFLRRYKKGVEKVLFSICVDGGKESASELAPKFIELLQKKLRKSDIIVQIKSDLILVFLPIITEEEGEMVIKRIEDGFYAENEESVHLRHVADHISFE